MTIKRTTCPLCMVAVTGPPIAEGVDTSHALWLEGIPTVLHWFQCEDCGHIFRQEEISDAALLARTLEHELPSAVRLRDTIATYVIPILASDRSDGPMLDFGCGSGAAGFCARSMGFDPIHFVDTRTSVTSILARIGETATSFIHPDTIAWYTLIFAGDVIEHVESPRALLTLLRSRLANDGRLIVSTPDGSSPIFKLAGNDNPYWREIEHRHVFTPSRLRRLARDCGLSLVRTLPHNRYLCGLDYIFERGELPSVE